jgi:hypothetical protein
MSKAPLILARWYDNQSTLAQEVLVAVLPGSKGPVIKIHALDQANAPAKSFSHNQIEWPPAWDPTNAPASITVRLLNSGTLKIEDPQAWEEALSFSSKPSGLIQVVQVHWLIFSSLLAGVLVLITLIARYATG